MQFHLRLSALLAIIFLPFAAFSHGYWIELEGNHKSNKEVTVKLFFGEYALGKRESGKMLDKMKDIKVSVTLPDGKTQDVAMTQQADYWTGSFIPNAKGMYTVTGVNDVREVQDWTKHDLGIVRPVQYLKAYYAVGKASAPAPADMFLNVSIAKTAPDTYELMAYKNGAPLTGQKISAQVYDNGEKVLTTDATGKATFKPAKPGLYILTLEHIDKTPGQFKGKYYESVRYILDASLYND